MGTFTASPLFYFIGWDVGGWNCDKNQKSRDAIVILDSNRDIVGIPWRGNLRATINEADTCVSWLEALFVHCGADLPATESIRVVLAIDTPLGFSEALMRLISRSGFDRQIGEHHSNPYLYRQTERFLFDRGLKPLSAIKDMIGSQATKGLHVIAKFTPKIARCGVWTNGTALTAIEAYPSACKKSALFQELRKRYVIGQQSDPSRSHWIESIDHQDKADALTCALVAFTFVFQPDELSHPPANTPINEGWIWVPNDMENPKANRAFLKD